ncbi:MAG: T9SS type A sorting domain-containing protein, partial [Flavobacteriales bacterium]
WADEESEQGSVHSNFQLSSLGEQLLLSYNNGFVIDSLTFGPLATDQSFARFPNGTGPFVEMNTTFNAVNEPVSIQESNSFAFAMYPNPTSDLVNFQFDNSELRNILVFSQDGRLMMNKQANKQLFSLDVQKLPQGIYHIQIQQGEQIAHSKICKL